MQPRKVNRFYSPKTYNDNDVTDTLLSREQNIAVLERDPNKEVSNKVYSNFDELFNTYLSKIPRSNVKRYVTDLFNKKLVFVGFSTRNESSVFARVMIPDGSQKLAGISLESGVLDIDLRTGDTDNIDDCIYATYYGLVRAAVLLNEREMTGNTDLNKLLTTYLYQIFLKAIGQRAVYSEKAKTLLRLACIYAYYRHFFNKNHQRALSIIKKEYANTFDNDRLKELLPLMDNISKYSSIREIPKMLINLNVIQEKPNAILLSLLQDIGRNTFYNIVGTLDHFIATVCTVKYPTNLLETNATAATKIHDSVESIVEKYMSKLKFEVSSVLVKEPE